MRGLEVALGQCSQHAFISSLSVLTALTEPSERPWFSLPSHLRTYPSPNPMPTSPKRGGRNTATTPGKNPPLIAETESRNRTKRIHHTANRESERNSEPLEEFANRVPCSNQLPAVGKLSRSLGLILKQRGLSEPFVSAQTS